MSVVAWPQPHPHPHTISHSQSFFNGSIQTDKLRFITTHIDFFLINIVKVINTQFSDCGKYYQICNIQMIFGRL